MGALRKAACLSVVDMRSKEQEIEQQLIKKLIDLNYVYRSDIRDLAALERNFRQKFEELNKVRLSDREFDRLLEQIIKPSVFENAQILRNYNTLERDDGTPLHYMLVNLKDWCKNSFEVVNQLRINTKSSHHRYDVILLINGLPLVHIELKALEVSPRRAMQQIVDYRKDPGNGYKNTLMAYVQLFIVSNRTSTWYFANNNDEHFSFDANAPYLSIYRWADPDNKKITHLFDFAEVFLNKCTLAEMISQYMVLVQSEKKILMMRPYQIYAVKAIIDTIKENRGHGYIWHTTGSGKTLTSFKAATLLKSNPDIEKCLFVVDRKDLDRQTREEFNRFQPGSVEENTNTESLVRRLTSDDYADKVIVTTIQKLGLALNDKRHWGRLVSLKDKRVAFIFDECHRSQFGENHKAIREFFPKAQFFGFTGTPIFEENATYVQIQGEIKSLKTTEAVFEKELHAYTITHAIEDGNVLPFRVEYYEPKGDVPVKPDERSRKRAIVDEVLKKHDAVTAKRKFNALFATASINDAIEYYELFKEAQEARQKEDPEYEPLNISCVFTPPAEGNQDILQLQEDLPQESLDNRVEPNKKKGALKKIIEDYNKRYGTNYDIYNFDLYYQDVQKRIKDQRLPNTDYPRSKKIDITIVVDMLLTGFDSKYLNTLYVDKNLKYHHLIQAFSRTNRVLDSSKPYGNILDFRGRREAVDKAIALFSGVKPEKAREIWLVEPAEKVIERLGEKVRHLKTVMELHGVEPKPEQVVNLQGDEARIEFVQAFKEVQRELTRLEQYTDLSEEDRERIESILPEEERLAFRSAYLETAKKLEEKRQEINDPNDPIQQIDFELMLFDEAIIDYDYIMRLIAKFSQTEPEKQEMTREQLVNLIATNAKFLDEREDLIEYIKGLEVGVPLTEEQIKKGYELFKAEKKEKALRRVADDFGLEYEAVKRFVDRTLERLVLDTDELTDLFAPLGLGWKARAKEELEFVRALRPLLRKWAEGREISGLEFYEG